MAVLASPNRSYARSRTVAVERRRLEARGLLLRVDQPTLQLPMAEPLLTPLDGPHRAPARLFAADRLAFLAVLGLGSFGLMAAAIQLAKLVAH
jgi:hypothetical protein